MKKIRIVRREKLWEDTAAYWKNCHCSTIAVNEKGDKLAAYFAGTKEGSPDLAIWISRNVRGVWEEPRRLAEVYGLCHYNPVLHYQDGRVWLFYKRGMNAPLWYTMVCHSHDFGRNWSVPKECIPGDHTPRCSSKNKIMVGSDGAWYGPCSVEKDTVWDCFIDRSRDYGRTWEKHEIPFVHKTGEESGDIAWEGIDALWETDPGVILKWDGVIQPSLWEWEPGKWSCLMRSTRGKIFRSDSLDGGCTWCEAYPTVLDNNNSGLDVAKLPDGTLVLAYNPVAGNWAQRTPLCLSLSENNGRDWGQPFCLEEGDGEYSYPAVISVDGRIHITYTSNRRDIIYCEAEIY